MTVSVSAAIRWSDPPSVLVDVTSSPSVTAPLVVYRVHDDGSRHKVIAGRSVLIGSWTGTDYHAPLNEPFHYVAAADGEDESAASASQYLPRELPWLIHPSDPALSLSLNFVVSLGPLKRAANVAKFKIAGSSVPVVRTESARGPLSGDITVFAEDDAEVRALDALLADSGPVLLNAGQSDRVPWVWISPGDTTRETPGGYFRTAYRQLSFAWEQCRAPDTDVAPLNTYPNIRSKGGYTTIKALYDGYRAMKLGIESP